MDEFKKPAFDFNRLTGADWLGIMINPASGSQATGRYATSEIKGRQPADDDQSTAKVCRKDAPAKYDRIPDYITPP